MAYVICCIVRNTKYYIQEYRKGVYLVNGLLDNAKQFLNEEVAREQIPKLQEKIKLEMFVSEILPTTEK